MRSIRKQLRNFVFTLNLEKNNVELEKVEQALKKQGACYYIIGKEIGENGNKHFQGYCELEKVKEFNVIHKTLFNAHIETRRGTQQQAIDYCKKEGDFVEWGTPKQQGKRNDLEGIIEMIREGASDIEILAEYPTQYFLYNQHIAKVRELITKERFEKEFRDITVYYIWGKTGTGKSRYVREKHGYKNVYAINDYGSGAFDSYTNQDVLILEEFRSDFTLKFMLQLLDGYPLRLPARYFDKIACFTKVYIVSNVRLVEQYKNIQEKEPASWAALLRRIKYIVEFGDDYEKNVKTMELLNKHF